MAFFLFYANVFVSCMALYYCCVEDGANWIRRKFYGCKGARKVKWNVVFFLEMDFTKSIKLGTHLEPEPSKRGDKRWIKLSTYINKSSFNQLQPTLKSILFNY